MATTEKLLADKAKAKARSGKKKPVEKPKLFCLIHPNGVTELAETQFYVVRGESIFSQVGKIMICKACCSRLYQQYYTETQDPKLSMYYACRKMDIAFINKVYESSFEECNGDWTRVLGFYMKNYSSLGAKNGWNYSFDNSESCDMDSSEVAEESELIESRGKLTREEKEIKKQVVLALNEDPFDSFPIQDQKYLYKKLLDYFKDEEILEDTYKVSQIIQLVVNNNQIRIFSNELGKLNMNPLDNMDKIKSLNAIIKDIVMNNDKIAKENGVSEKNKKNQNVGGNTLGSLMKTMRSLNFKDAEQDFYDMKKAYGMQQAELKSLQNIKEQIVFDEQDIDDMINYQREMIRDLQGKLMDKEEEIRMLVSGEVKNVE